MVFMVFIYFWTIFAKLNHCATRAIILKFLLLFSFLQFILGLERDQKQTLKSFSFSFQVKEDIRTIKMDQSIQAILQNGELWKKLFSLPNEMILTPKVSNLN